MTELRRVVLEGELTIITAAEQKQRLMSALQGSAGVRLDLSGVEEMDTAGLQLLLLAQQEAARLSLVFEIGAASRSAAGVLAVAQLDVGPARRTFADEER